jgi:uncharacterized pyridoxamine 5'-phosphate oxidase family protein
MNEVLKFLTDNQVFYLTTVDGNTPKVRPFGFVMEFGGKLCFCTNNQKNVYRQMKSNPKIEIAVTSKTGEWLRLAGEAVFLTSQESKKAALDAMPSLGKMYRVDDSIFEIFSVENAEAIFYNSNGTSRTVKF